MIKILILAACYYFLGIDSNNAYTIRQNWLNNDDNFLKNNSTTFTFNCTNRPIGFYADVEYNCQIFHMCDQEGHRIPHSCANDTGFNQEYRICDWTSNFDCNDAPRWYYLNSLTYAIDSAGYSEEN